MASHRSCRRRPDYRDNDTSTGLTADSFNQHYTRISAAR